MRDQLASYMQHSVDVVEVGRRKDVLLLLYYIQFTSVILQMYMYLQMCKHSTYNPIWQTSHTYYKITYQLSLVTVNNTAAILFQSSNVRIVFVRNYFVIDVIPHYINCVLCRLSHYRTRPWKLNFFISFYYFFIGLVNHQLPASSTTIYNYYRVKQSGVRRRKIIEHVLTAYTSKKILMIKL